MNDRHLNLFYTYNRGNELIENNLTRAWIVTLRLLSAETRNSLLQALLDAPLQEIDSQVPAFDQASFALQGYFDTRLLERISQKFIVTIATERALGDEASLSGDPDLGDSIPDAWIYDPEQRYCFLIEAKIGANPLGAAQVYSHAAGWLGIPGGKVQDHLIVLTWYDILNAIQLIQTDIDNSQDAQLLQEFTQFLGFFNYRLFTGFNFSELLAAPGFSISD